MKKIVFQLVLIIVSVLVLSVLNANARGQAAIDFTAQDINGNNIKLKTALPAGYIPNIKIKPGSTPYSATKSGSISQESGRLRARIATIIGIAISSIHNNIRTFRFFKNFSNYITFYYTMTNNIRTFNFWIITNLFYNN